MDEEIKQLLEKNLALTQEIHGMTKKIRSYIKFQRMVSIFYLLIIVIPIILSIIYLPPLLKNYIGLYQGMLGGDSGNNSNIQSPINKFLK